MGAVTLPDRLLRIRDHAGVPAGHGRAVRRPVSPGCAAIIRDLDAKAITYETRGDGQTIMAPRSDLARIRMDLAGKGMPSGGGVGYEIFDKGDAFSSTSFVQNINHLRALEGELSRTIRSIGRVRGAPASTSSFRSAACSSATARRRAPRSC